MKRTTSLLAAVAFCAACSTLFAGYSVTNEGTWPKNWPQELEPLRKQARTLDGPLEPRLHYEIPFTKRERFESAWPHLLKVKSHGAPIILVRAPKTDFMAINPAGVLIHSPPAGTEKPANAKGSRSNATGARSDLVNTTYIELVVDGDIVDLNRIPLPPDTPIIDKRFNDAPAKSPKPSGE